MYTPDALVKLAVQDIVSHINSGLSPQEATTKVAKDLSLNHNFIKRSAEAINVALHHNHFKKHPEAKAADFETVDAQKVADDIYGTKEKTASEFRSELFSSFQMPDEVAPKFARYLEDGPYKEAYAKLALTEVTKTATSEKGVYEKAANYIKMLKDVAYDLEGEKLGAAMDVDQSFCNILRKFATDNEYRSSWDAFETGVFSKYGEKSVQYLDLLYKTANLKEARGAHDPNVKLAQICPEVALYDNFVEKIAKLKEATQASEDAAYNLSFESDYLKQAFEQRGCELDKISDYNEASLLEKVEASMKAERQKIASADTEDPVMAEIAEKRAKVVEEFDSRIKCAIDLIDMATGYAKEQSRPALSANTNNPELNRSRALVLQELIATDPIISKFPTHHTVDAYQQLLRLAPELSNEKEVTRAFLRQAGASQAIDPFQTEQLIKTNTGLFKQHLLQKGINSGPGSEANTQ